MKARLVFVVEQKKESHILGNQCDVLSDRSVSCPGEDEFQTSMQKRSAGEVRQLGPLEISKELVKAFEHTPIHQAKNTAKVLKSRTRQAHCVG